MSAIEIENLKHIRFMRFEVPGPGVWVLCGSNGAGKTSLLACLLRLGTPVAFPAFFRTSRASAQLDQIDGAEVRYFASGRSVTYAYRGQRWAPRPRSNADVLREFGYPSVIYLGANAARLEPRPEDFVPQRVRDVGSELAAAAVEVLGDRFQNLKQIHIGRTGSKAFLLLDNNRIAANRNQRNYYFSEKNFSLGELCVLKLLRQLLTCPDRALVLVDELELALHPSVQLALVRFLERLARSKGLTVIVSTHSVSLIRAVRQSQLLLLQSGANGVICIQGAYPAHAVGAIGATSDAAPDIALFVEDEFARFIVESSVSTLISTRLATGVTPSVAVQPIGGFKNVISFLENAPSVLAASTKYFALLDRDVENESLAEARAQGNHAFLDQVERLGTRIRFLPWTPEVGVANRISRVPSESLMSMKEFFQDHRIALPAFDWAGCLAHTGAQTRQLAKEGVRLLVADIARLKGMSDREGKRAFAQWFAREELHETLTSATLTSLLMPLLR